jgi:hypothetical protein
MGPIEILPSSILRMLYRCCRAVEEATSTFARRVKKPVSDSFQQEAGFSNGLKFSQDAELRLSKHTRVQLSNSYLRDQTCNNAFVKVFGCKTFS